MSGITIFVDDDAAYLTWIASHPDGFVVNTRKPVDSSYAVLHRATCRTVSRYPGMAEHPGGFTERAYQKICSEDIEQLRRTLASQTARAGGFSARCAHCAP